MTRATSSSRERAEDAYRIARAVGPNGSASVWIQAIENAIDEALEQALRPCANTSSLGACLHAFAHHEHGGRCTVSVEVDEGRASCDCTKFSWAAVGQRKGSDSE
jgi:hypothetical protein